jgi:hypothetical protein
MIFCPIYKISWDKERTAIQDFLSRCGHLQIYVRDIRNTRERTEIKIGLSFSLPYSNIYGHAVAYLFEALCYKLEGRGSETDDAIKFF